DCLMRAAARVDRLAGQHARATEIEDEAHERNLRLLALVVRRIRVQPVAEVGDRLHRAEGAGAVHTVPVELRVEVARVRPVAQALPVPLSLRVAAVVGGVDAAGPRIARVVRAYVPVVAIRRSPAGAAAPAARVVRRTGVAVVAWARVVDVLASV